MSHRDLEMEHKLNHAKETIQEMKKRERELTDRYNHYYYKYIPTLTSRVHDCLIQLLLKIICFW